MLVHKVGCYLNTNLKCVSDQKLGIRQWEKDRRVWMGVMEKKNLDFLEQIVSKNIDMKDAGKKML